MMDDDCGGVEALVEKIKEAAKIAVMNGITNQSLIHRQSL